MNFSDHTRLKIWYNLCIIRKYIIYTAKQLQSINCSLIVSYTGATNLHTLHVSHNALGSTGVELLLKCLSANAIVNLDLSCVITTAVGNNLTKHMASYLSQVSYLLMMWFAEWEGWLKSKCLCVYVFEIGGLVKESLRMICVVCEDMQFWHILFMAYKPRRPLKKHFAYF